MCEYFCLEKSLITLALKKDFCFISAFPGFFIFGFVTKSHYEKNKFFQFSHFDLPKLYTALLKVIHFMSDETDRFEKTEVITKQIEDCKVSYYIFGNVSVNEKEVKFCLQVNLFNLFDLSLNAFQLNDFLSAISDILIACLCLNPIEKK
jgi:hypothetical protein